MAHDDDDDGVCTAGGFRQAQTRHLALLAQACGRADIVEVQRLAAMALTWWNGTSWPLRLSALSEEHLRDLRRRAHEHTDRCSVNG